MSWTKIGSVLVGAAMIVKVRWPEWGAVVEAVGIAVGGIGLRDAIAKNGIGR